MADPDAVYGPPVVYGPPALYAPAYNPVLGPGYVQTPYLDCVGSDCLEETDGTTVSPVPEVTRPGKEPPPLPPAPQLQPRTPAATSPETTVPQRKAEGSGPDLSPLPALPPQSSSRVAPRFFPTNGPALLPPGTIRQNGFDAGPRPNRPSLPGNDPFGPPRDPAELPET